MRFIGLDLHKRQFILCAMNRSGKVLFRESVECRREALVAFAKARLCETDQLAVEATTNTWAVADTLRPFVASINRAKLLMTLPGVAHGVAITLLGALGDIPRFKDGDHAASYLGLTPRLYQSGSKSRFGRITKSGCPQTRATLVQAVQAASGHPGPIGAFFR